MKPARTAEVTRDTRETQIRTSLAIDGRGTYDVSTGIRFFDHMLESFAKHGGFDLRLRAKGDLDVDQHHTVEDCGIVLGQAFCEALGSRVGILRSGYFLMPMDETLAAAAVDLSGRPALVYHAPFGSSETYRPNCCTTSSTDSPCTAAQTCTCAFFTDARATTALKRCSNAGPRPCVSPVPRTIG